MVVEQYCLKEDKDMLNEEEFNQIIDIGHELTNIELKGPCSAKDKHKFAKIARAIMGMANRRDGGMVIVGIEDSNGKISECGLEPGDLATWKYDELSTAMAEFSDPNVEFELEKVEFNEKQYVVIRVQEFREIPVLCTKDFNYQSEHSKSHTVTRKGACYVRSTKKPETVEIPSQTEMRELLDLAIEKGIRRFLQRAQNVGLDSSQLIIDKDLSQYNDQINRSNQSVNLVEKILSRGYWQVTIRPVRFMENRVAEIDKLLPILDKTSVRLLGWDFPHIDIKSSPKIFRDFIQQEFDWNHFVSLWSFFQSGQLYYLFGNHKDWRDQSITFPIRDGEIWEPDKLLDINIVVYNFTEIFEFAARLSMTEAGDEKMHVGVLVGNLKDRMLYSRHGLFQTYKTSMIEYPIDKEFDRADLLANARDIAVIEARELMLRFNLKLSIEEIKEMQKKLIS